MLKWTSSVVEVTILPVIFCTQRMHAGHFCTFHQHLLHLHSNNFLVWFHAGKTTKELENDNKQTKVMPVMVSSSTVSVSVGSNPQRHFPFVQKKRFFWWKTKWNGLLQWNFSGKLGIPSAMFHCSHVYQMIRKSPTPLFCFFTLLQYSLMKQRVVLVGNEMEWSFPLFLIDQQV